MGSSFSCDSRSRGWGRLRQLTNRFLNKIKSVGGFVFYVGIHKRYSPESYDANKLYLSVLCEAIKRLDQHCANPNSPNVSSIHPERCGAAGRNPRWFITLADMPSRRPSWVALSEQMGSSAAGKARRRVSAASQVSDQSLPSSCGQW
jgi:hypothetical protein